MASAKAGAIAFCTFYAATAQKDVYQTRKSEFECCELIRNYNLSLN
jgi:hypothetical protein